MILEINLLFDLIFVFILSELIFFKKRKQHYTSESNTEQAPTNNSSNRHFIDKNTLIIIVNEQCQFCDSHEHHHVETHRNAFQFPPKKLVVVVNEQNGIKADGSDSEIEEGVGGVQPHLLLIEKVAQLEYFYYGQCTKYL